MTTQLTLNYWGNQALNNLGARAESMPGPQHDECLLAIDELRPLFGSKNGAQVTAEKQQGLDNELAARIANELAKVYNANLYDISKTQAREKLKFIETQLPISKAALDLSIQKVREYKEAKQIFLISEEAKALLDVIVDFDKRLNAKKMELQTTQAGIAVIREKLSATNEKLISSETISINPLVSELRSKLTNLNIELAALEKLYPATDPRVLQKRKSIEETQKELSKQVVNIVTSQQKIDNPIYSALMAELVAKEIDFQLSAATIEALENGRKEYDRKMKGLPALEQELTELLREENINEQVYIAIYKSYIDAQIAEAGIVGGLELAVGDDVAQGRFTGGVGRAGDVGGDRADNAVGQRGGHGVVLGDQVGHPVALGHVAGDDHVVDADRSNFARPAREFHVDVGN